MLGSGEVLGSNEKVFLTLLRDGILHISSIFGRNIKIFY